MRILLFIIFLCLATPSVQIFACTGFFATQGKTALVGNNEDYFDTTQTKILVKAAEGNKYGRLFFGFASSTPHYGFGEFNPQGGMNEQGLFFDCFATPLLPVTASVNKPKFKDHPFEVLLAECATVQDVLVKFSNYDLRKGLVYVYYHHNFSNEIVINLKNEFIKGKRSYDLQSLFTK